MNFRTTAAIVTGIIALGIASPTWANSIHRKDLGASDNGVADSSFSDCMNGGTGGSFTGGAGNCAAALDTGTPIDGAEIFNFVTNQAAGTSAPVFEVFTIPGAVTPGESFTFTFKDVTAGYGIFACDSPDPTQNGKVLETVLNGGGTLAALNIPCTPGSPSDPAVISLLSDVSNDGAETATLTFTTGTPLTLFTTEGNLISFAPATSGGGGGTSMPEPGSLTLLGFGLVGLALLSRRATVVR